MPIYEICCENAGKNNKNNRHADLAWSVIGLELCS